eukprot:gene16318-17961_t
MPDTNLPSSVAEHRECIVRNLEEAQCIISLNTELAQQRMKLQYDKTSAPVRYDIGSKLWVYTPKSRKGLPKKLSHDYHGPYRIVAKLSPVHFKLRTVNNHPVFVPMHANRLKPFYDAAHRPIEFPTEAVSLPDLIDSALPPDSFTVHPPASTPAADSPDLIVPDSNDEPAISRPEDFHRPLEIHAV